MNQSKPSDILPEPPEELKQHSRRLVARIVDRIRNDGPISFAQYMEMALYEPGLGYYSAGLHKFGARGDFVTAPELGDVFGACLARQVTEIADTMDECNILEIGAGSGALAAQLMAELDALALDPESRVSLPESRSYSILETSGDLRAVQQQRLESRVAGDGWDVRWLDKPPEKAWSGIILANEVVDALPVERFLISDGAVRQVCVTAMEGKLEFADRAAPAELSEAVMSLGNLPNGYRSEVSVQLEPWLESVTRNLQHGVALFVDYGYPQNEFYLSHRRAGTVMAHYRHRAHGSLLRYPGLQDLTAFVDFTALSRAGSKAGLDLLGYTSQALFLMGSGLDEVVHARLTGDSEADMALNNQVRQLVFPDLMGEKFQVIAFGRNRDEQQPLRGFSFRDLSDRL